MPTSTYSAIDVSSDQDGVHLTLRDPNGNPFEKIRLPFETARQLLAALPLVITPTR